MPHQKILKNFLLNTFWAVLGCNDYTLFARGELDSIEVLPSLKNFTSPSECHLCLGILNINKFDSYRQKFRESVENWPLTKENSAKEVQLLISIPASILLLEKIIFFKLRKEFPDANMKELSPVSLKEIIKTVCCYKTFDKSKVFISSERFVQHWILLRFFIKYHKDLKKWRDSRNSLVLSGVTPFWHVA